MGGWMAMAAGFLLLLLLLFVSETFSGAGSTVHHGQSLSRVFLSRSRFHCVPHMLRQFR